MQLQFFFSLSKNLIYLPSKNEIRNILADFLYVLLTIISSKGMKNDTEINNRQKTDLNQQRLFKCLIKHTVDFSLLFVK